MSKASNGAKRSRISSRASRRGMISSTTCKVSDCTEDGSKSWCDLAQVKPNDRRSRRLLRNRRHRVCAGASAGAQVTAVDFSEPMLDVAKARARTKRILADQFSARRRAEAFFSEPTRSISSALAMDCGTFRVGKRVCAEMHRVARTGRAFADSRIWQTRQCDAGAPCISHISVSPCPFLENFFAAMPPRTVTFWNR